MSQIDDANDEPTRVGTEYLDELLVEVRRRMEELLPSVTEYRRLESAALALSSEERAVGRRKRP